MFGEGFYKVCRRVTEVLWNLQQVYKRFNRRGFCTVYEGHRGFTEVLESFIEGVQRVHSFYRRLIQG